MFELIRVIVNCALVLAVFTFVYNSGVLDPAFAYVNETWHMDLKAQIGALLDRLPKPADLIDFQNWNFDAFKTMLNVLTTKKQ